MSKQTLLKARGYREFMDEKGSFDYNSNDVKKFFMEKIKSTKDFSLNTIINSFLKQDIEISKKLA